MITSSLENAAFWFVALGTDIGLLYKDISDERDSANKSTHREFCSYRWLSSPQLGTLENSTENLPRLRRGSRVW
jgi:hypothetical protein